MIKIEKHAFYVLLEVTDELKLKILNSEMRAKPEIRWDIVTTQGRVNLTITQVTTKGNYLHCRAFLKVDDRLIQKEEIFLWKGPKV